MISTGKGKIKTVTIYAGILLNITILMILAILCDGAEFQRKKLCKISEKRKTADCSGHGKNMSKIPDLPNFVQKLCLDSDNFVWITKNTFQPIYRNNISLVSLSVKSSRVHHIGKEAFSNLSSFSSLDLSFNPKLNVTSLKNSFDSLKSTKFETLTLSLMNWTARMLPQQFFISFSSKAIGLISLAHNNISSFPSSFLEGLQKLRRIDLSYNTFKACDKQLSTLKIAEEINLDHNSIFSCNVTHLPKRLKVLRLANNCIRKVPSFCSSTRQPLLPTLEILFLNENLISDLKQRSFACLPNLKKLHLKLNEIRHFRSRVFSNLPNLELLNLRQMKRKVTTVDKEAFSIPSLKKFLFDKNNFDFGSKENARRASFGNCTNLEEIDLSHNYMPKWSPETGLLLNGLKRLQTIHLNQVRWNVLPNNLFKMIPNVRKVDLSSNGITQLNSSLFLNESKIVHMNLESNRIAHVGPDTFPEVFWESIKVIDLSGNPFACDCQLLWFRDLLRQPKQSNVTFKRYPRGYSCLSPPERKGLKLANFNMTSEECQKKSELIIILATSGSFVVVGLLLTLAVYKGRWHIRYWIYLLRYKKNGYSRIIDGDFEFDGFIIYSDADSDFVHNTLLTKLEKENGYKMCVHFRDFEVGKIIVDNIVECMSQSRHALVVVSKQFCLSKWCKFELLVAQDRWLRNEGDPLIIVMLEEVDSQHMTQDLSALIQTTTYCSWTQSEVGQELFWEQLFNSFKKYG
ncbi:hypothetical protein FSP39_018500 [Pinctada imbricata]|uniref:TIR domain-containing protein n=1 Tax=Pinctada imbricata TaxID=66713 RepID=A0AA89BQ03_PINIB|nr:hypothetical protein FSP39_018500 [Pinctada imbricata]